jgi:nucleoid-associated protein YgaU
MQPRDEAAPDARPRSYIALSPATVGVLGLLVIGLVFALKSFPVAAAPAAPAVPAYPDLRPQVTELEQQLAAVKAAPPAYPNLTDKVAALESTLAVVQGQLEEAQAAPEYVTLRNRLAALESELTATRDALAVAKKGDVEAQLRIERDDLAGRTARLTSEVTQLRGDRERMQRLLAATGQQLRQASTEKTALSGREAALAAMVDELQSTRSALATAQDEANRANEALAALQRSSSRTLAEAGADRARLDQLRGTNAFLTDENQRLKSGLARGGGAPNSPTPLAVARTHIVAAGDSLANLSQRYYGTPARWQEIYNANADLLGPTGLLRVDYVLRIP